MAVKSEGVVARVRMKGPLVVGVVVAMISSYGNVLETMILWLMVFQNAEVAKMRGSCWCYICRPLSVHAAVLVEFPKDVAQHGRSLASALYAHSSQDLDERPEIRDLSSITIGVDDLAIYSQ